MKINMRLEFTRKTDIEQVRFALIQLATEAEDLLMRLREPGSGGVITGTRHGVDMEIEEV